MEADEPLERPTFSPMSLRQLPLPRLWLSVALLLTLSVHARSQTTAPVVAPSVGSATHPDPNALNRVGPKRRKGKEGSEDAELDASQARELYRIRKLRLEQIKARQQEIVKDQRALAANRARMHARLVETAKALKISERRLTEIEEHLAVTRAQGKEQRAKLEDKSAQMSALFVLMQNMSRQPPPVMITHSKDALKMIRSGMVLAAFYADVEKLAAQLSAEVDRLDGTQKEAELQEQRRKTEQAHNGRLKSQIDLLLSENREQLEMTLENIETLKAANAINIAGLRTLEEALPVLEAAAAKKQKLGPGRSAASILAASSQNTARFASLQPGRMEPAIPFAKSQGLLPFPIQGRTLIKFGQLDREGGASKGIHMEGRFGAQVVSPCDGTILYAGPFRTYGQLLIIDAGGGYHVVLAGMDRIQVVHNQAVLAGEPVATMALDQRPGEKISNRPILYVEFRRDQQTIDPAPWWSAEGKG
jgi:murein hydrolase activator